MSGDRVGVRLLVNHLPPPCPARRLTSATGPAPLGGEPARRRRRRCQGLTTPLGSFRIRETPPPARGRSSRTENVRASAATARNKWLPICWVIALTVTGTPTSMTPMGVSGATSPIVEGHITARFLMVRSRCQRTVIVGLSFRLLRSRFCAPGAAKGEVEPPQAQPRMHDLTTARPVLGGEEDGGPSQVMADFSTRCGPVRPGARRNRPRLAPRPRTATLCVVSTANPASPAGSLPNQPRNAARVAQRHPATDNMAGGGLEPVERDPVGAHVLSPRA